MTEHWWAKYWPFGVPAPYGKGCWDEAQLIVELTLLAKSRQRVWNRYGKKRRLA